MGEGAEDEPGNCSTQIRQGESLQNKTEETWRDADLDFYHMSCLSYCLLSFTLLVLITYKNSQQHKIPWEAPPTHKYVIHISILIVVIITRYSY